MGGVLPLRFLLLYRSYLMKICVRGDFGEIEWALPENFETLFKNFVKHLPEEKQDITKLEFIKILTNDLSRLLTLEWVSARGICINNPLYDFIIRAGIDNIFLILEQTAKADLLEIEKKNKDLNSQ
jgi:hypothetical protein